VEQFWWTVSDDDRTTASPAVPCIPISAKEMADWAQMQMGRGHQASVFVFDSSTQIRIPRQPKPADARDFERMLSVFRSEAPEAFRLATYLAAGPFTLPVARLVQEAKFGAADQAHLAEVLLSGLVSARFPRDGSEDANSIFYEFYPEARKILLRSLRKADAQSIALELETRVSQHIEEIQNRQISFRALVPDRNGRYDLPGWAQPFAILGTSLLGIAPVSPIPGELVNRFETTNSSKTVRAAARLASIHPSEVLDPSLKGTGLGAALLEGRLVTEDPTGGWRFAAGASDLLARGLLSGIQLLWVDDHPENNIAEENTFQAMGARITRARSTEEALSALAQSTYDLVISDWSRGTTGTDAGLPLLRRMRRQGITLPFILYTHASGLTKRDRVRAQAAGAFGFAVDVTELTSIVLRAVEGIDQGDTHPTISPSIRPKAPSAADLSDFNIVVRLPEGKESLRRIAWSPNSRYLAASLFDGAVHIWDMRTGRLLRSLDGHTQVVYSVSWSPDSERLASGSGDGSVRIWNCQSGEVGRVLRGRAGGVLGVAWSPTGAFVACGTNNGSVLVWDLTSGVETVEGMRHNGPVHTVAWAPTGKRLASASNDRTVRVWDISGKRREVLTLTHRGQVYGVAYSPDGSLLASSGASGSIHLWQQNGKPACEPFGHTQPVTDLSFSADGRLLSTLSWDNTIRIWDVRTQRQVASFAATSARRFHAGIAFNPQSGYSIAFTTDGASAVEVWQPASERGTAYWTEPDPPAKQTPETREVEADDLIRPTPSLLEVLTSIGISQTKALELWRAGPQELGRAVLLSISNQNLAFNHCLRVVQAFAESGWNQLLLLLRPQQLMVVAEQIDPDKKTYRYPAASWSGIIGQAASSLRPVWVPNVAVASGYIHAVPTTTAEFAIPLLQEDGRTALGVINLELTSGQTLSADQQQWLIDFCKPLANRIAARDRVVFIGCLREDLQMVARLEGDLQRAGMFTWHAWSEISADDTAPKSAKAAVENSGTAIFVLSRKALSSSWVKESIEFAMVNQSFLRISVAMIEDCPVPRELMSFPQFRFDRNFAAALRELMNELGLSQPGEELRSRWHPPEDFDRRGPLTPCSFTISPRYQSLGGSRWQRWADVLVQLEQAPNNDYVYMIPSRFSPETLHQPEQLADPSALEEKRSLTSKFVEANLQSQLTGLRFTKNMASGTQAIHVYCREYDDFLRGLRYRANANALHGEVAEPIHNVIAPQVAVTLPEAGGFISNRLGGYRLDGIISFASAHTEVAGKATDDGWTTMATASIEKLNLFDVVTADRVVARILVNRVLDGNEAPKISFLGTVFENLRIRGEAIEVELAYEQGGIAFRKISSQNAERRSEPSTRRSLGSLVKTIRGIPATSESLPATVRENTIELPGLARLFLCEAVVDRDSCLLQMMRMVFSSEARISIAIATCQAGIGVSEPAQVQLA
jgi:CheY-like chemotaxis protein